MSRILHCFSVGKLHLCTKVIIKLNNLFQGFFGFLVSCSMFCTLSLLRNLLKQEVMNYFWKFVIGKCSLRKKLIVAATKRGQSLYLIQY